MTITFGSVCSGIEAASVAWEPLGWKAAWLAETASAPSRILSHRYPHTPNLGDMTCIDAEVPLVHEIDVLVGGTPCQAFSIAGLKKSLEDERGNLTIAFCRLAKRIARHGRLKTIVWENVPGVLNTKDNAFGCFLGLLVGEDVPLVPCVGSGEKWPNAGCVYGPAASVAWRVLDAQYFGLAQRRKRVFVVGCLGGWADPAQILFEFAGVRRDHPPRRQAGEGFTHDVAPCIDSSGCGIARTGDNRGQQGTRPSHRHVPHGGGAN